MYTIVRRAIRKKIGELLIERHVIDSGQLEKALSEQKEKGGYISQHLIALGFATELDIVNCLSAQYNIAYMPLAKYRIGKEILDIVPLKLVKIFSVLPLDKIGRRLTVVVADPLNEGLIELLRQATNCDIVICISTYNELREAIDRYYGDKFSEMEKYGITKEDLLKEDIIQPFIQTASINPEERRQYKRINTDLEIDYFLHGRNYQGRICNISYVGLYFFCSSFISLDTNILCKVFLKKDRAIDVVVQVARVESIDEESELVKQGASDGNYGVAGFFNFLTEDDKKHLFFFLREHSNV